MILISSAEFVNNEFQIEFGCIPPSFLPIGNVRLYQHQIENLKKVFPKENIYISLPATFKIPNKDLRYLKNENITILSIKEKLTLADSVANSIKLACTQEKSLKLLHGDTLIIETPTEDDVIGIGNTTDYYNWEIEKTGLFHESVWCGYFAFSNLKLFTKALRSSKKTFTVAIKNYDKKIAMRRTKIRFWYDFGHINTYFQSRQKITTERAFNSLKISGGCVQKTGYRSEKINAEKNWYTNIPKKLRVYCPQLIDSGLLEDKKPYYSIEYLPLPSLNDVYVHGKNPVFFWTKIFNCCDDFLQRCKSLSQKKWHNDKIKKSSQSLIIKKTFQRIDEFILQTKINFKNYSFFFNNINLPSLDQIVLNCIQLTDQNRIIPGIIHGDFCLSNILFDSRCDRIKVIDPRGLDANGRHTILGDQRYDLAKLTHSIIGLYDHIIAGEFELETRFNNKVVNVQFAVEIDQRIRKIQNIFLNKVFINTIKPFDVMPMVVLLFISMLPLHAENPRRQFAMLANALRLYTKYVV